MMIVRWKCTNCFKAGSFDWNHPFDQNLCLNSARLIHSPGCGDTRWVDLISELEIHDEPNIAESQVDHPKHYQHASGVEAITICRHENFNIGNAIKYILRSPNKGNQIQDLNKARWYLADEIERLGGKTEERT